MSSKCSCVIPFYNESEQILSVLEAAANARNISEIICVDDGSTNNTARLVTKKFPRVKIIHLKQNSGKVNAVRVGVKTSKNDYVLLLDADLRFLKSKELDQAIQKTIDQDLDMMILNLINAPWILKINRDILFSGVRIVKRDDLLKILSFNIARYELEVAINSYMLKNNKTVRWYPSSALNTPKMRKWGLLPGLKRDVVMFKDMFEYEGFMKYLQNILNFTWTKAE